ncbi:MAG: hypothetical protein QM500_02805 [Methylococcales bacterium]
MNYLDGLLFIFMVTLLIQNYFQKIYFVNKDYKITLLIISVANILLCLACIYMSFILWQHHLEDNYLYDVTDHTFYLMFLSVFWLINLVLVIFKIYISYENKWIILFMKASLFLSCISGWLALSNGVPFMESISITWLILYFITLTLTYISISFSRYIDIQVKHSKLNSLSKFSFVSSFLSLLLTVRIIPAVVMAVWNADIMIMVMSFFTVFLFIAGIVTWSFDKKKLVTILYLRRFGHSDVNDFIKRAIKNNRGQVRYRLITLDDLKFLPSKSNRKPLLIFLITAVCLLFPSLLVLDYFLVQFEELFGFSEGALYGESMIVSIQLVIAIMFLCLTPVVTILLVTFLLSNLKRRKQVKYKADVDKISASIARCSGLVSRIKYLSMPIASVIRSSHEIWKYSVSQLALKSDIIVIEVSNVSEAVDWEVKQLSLNSLERSMFLLNDKKNDGVFKEKYPNEKFKVLNYNLVTNFQHDFLITLDRVLYSASSSK